MTQTYYCFNAFHLGPNEMHFAMHVQSRGQTATAPQNYLTARFKLGRVALAQSHNGSTAGRPGSNLRKVLPRETHVIETVPVSPPFHTVHAYYFVFYVRDYPETMTDLYSLPSLFLFSFSSPHGFLHLLLPPPPPLAAVSFPVCDFTRSPTDHL